MWTKLDQATPIIHSLNPKVAVRVRPLSDKEIREGGTECVEVKRESSRDLQAKQAKTAKRRGCQVSDTSMIHVILGTRKPGKFLESQRLEIQ